MLKGILTIIVSFAAFVGLLILVPMGLLLGKGFIVFCLILIGPIGLGYLIGLSQSDKDKDDKDKDEKK